MSKRLHPIRKMRRELLYPSDVGLPNSIALNYERAIARHVKPLLDALDYAEFFCPPGPSREELSCLLAEWRAKL